MTSKNFYSPEITGFISISYSYAALYICILEDLAAILLIKKYFEMGVS